MNKVELIAAVAEKAGLSKKDSDKAVAAVRFSRRVSPLRMPSRNKRFVSWKSRPFVRAAFCLEQAAGHPCGGERAADVYSRRQFAGAPGVPFPTGVPLSALPR